jgi:hypothetical protein
MLAGLRFEVPGLPFLSTTLGGNGAAVDGGEGVLFIKISNETSVPSAFLSLAACGINAREPTSERLAPYMEGVDGIDGGGVEPKLFEKYARAEG